MNIPWRSIFYRVEEGQIFRRRCGAWFRTLHQRVYPGEIRL